MRALLNMKVLVVFNEIYIPNFEPLRVRVLQSYKRTFLADEFWFYGNNELVSLRLVTSRIPPIMHFYLSLMCSERCRFQQRIISCKAGLSLLLSLPRSNTMKTLQRLALFCRSKPGKFPSSYWSHNNFSFGWIRDVKIFTVENYIQFRELYCERLELCFYRHMICLINVGGYGFVVLCSTFDRMFNLSGVRFRLIGADNHTTWKAYFASIYSCIKKMQTMLVVILWEANHLELF